MNRPIRRLAVVPLTALLAATLPGCGMLESEPEKSLNELNRAYDELSDALETVKDAESAQAAVEDVQAAFAHLQEVVERIPELMRKYKDKKVSKRTVDKINSNRQKAERRAQKELERVTTVRGLPVEFWRVAREGGFNLALAGIEILQSAQGNVPKEALDFLRNTRDLLAKHGHERVVSVDCTNLPPELAQKAYDKIRCAAPQASMYHLADTASDTHSVTIGPVDFQAVVAAIDFGTLTTQDEPRRAITVRVDRRSLGARANSDAEEQQLREQDRQRSAEERRRESRQRQEEAEASIARLRQGREEREKQRRMPQPGDPDYYERLLERVLSDDHFRQRDAIKVLLRTEPSQVPSAETRKKIARAFKDLAFGDGHSHREEGVKGLVIWGGKYSVPLLLELLEEDPPFIKEDIFKALGQLKDKRAAAPVAARLGNFFDGGKARTCLRRMGSVAEDALLEVAPSNDAKVCLAAIELLGEVGTEKSLPTLRSAQRSRNPNVKMAAKLALKKVLQRKNQANDPNKPGQ